MATAEVRHGSVEALERVLSYLVRERQELRRGGVPGAELEANRRAIVALQWQLDRALGERYGKSPPPADG
jgi:hypothetical protein